MSEAAQAQTPAPTPQETTPAAEAAPATESVPEQEAAPATEQPKEETTPSIDEFASEKMDDEITLHSDGEDTPIQDKEAAIEMIEVFDEVETEDTSTLGRFASLRDEIRGDEETTTSSEPVEDRMNQFFES